jgi:hypothetical protein
MKYCTGSYYLYSALLTMHKSVDHKKKRPAAGQCAFVDTEAFPLRLPELSQTGRQAQSEQMSGSIRSRS